MRRAGSDLSGSGLIHSLMAVITPLSMNVSFRSCLEESVGEGQRSEQPTATPAGGRQTPGDSSLLEVHDYMRQQR